METHATERVFSAAAGQIERLPRVLRRLAAVVRTRPLRVVEDRYLDTPTRLLMRAGVACRRRQVGQRATLTLMSLTPLHEGLADRVELSEALPPGDWTGPGPLPGQEVRTRLLPLTRRLDIERLFELEQTRRLYDVRTRDGARLEVFADRTSLAGSNGDDVLQRIGVELREGSAESLMRFASDLRRALKLKPAKESTFDYALREAGLTVPVPVEGPALRIRPRDTVRQAAARALTLHFRRLLWHVPGTRLGINPECLHDLRVSVRRLRAILRLFRDFLPPATAAKLAEELKWLGQSLGSVRDLDVHLQECAALLGRLPEAARAASEPCRRAMSRRRERAYDAMCRELRSPRFGALKSACRDLIRRLRRPAAAGSAAIAAAGASLMESELKSILKAGRGIAADTPAGTLHRLRVRCKRLRYACETLREVYGKAVAKMARRLAALQDVLGAHQDAVAAQALIERAMAESASATPDGVEVAYALGRCAAGWREEQLARRAAFPATWKAFDRKKVCRSFRRALRQPPRG
jgi:CHAD domain-containing protein